MAPSPPSGTFALATTKRSSCQIEDAQTSPGSGRLRQPVVSRNSQGPVVASEVSGVLSVSSTTQDRPARAERTVDSPSSPIGSSGVTGIDHDPSGANSTMIAGLG